MCVFVLGLSPPVKKAELDSPSPQEDSPRLGSFTQHHRPVIAVHSGQSLSLSLSLSCSLSLSLSLSLTHSHTHSLSHTHKVFYQFVSSLHLSISLSTSVQVCLVVPTPLQLFISHPPPTFPMEQSAILLIWPRTLWKIWSHWPATLPIKPPAQWVQHSKNSKNGSFFFTMTSAD